MTDEAGAKPPQNASFELASRNTVLALERTRMAADRTLMAVIRTSLSLISFGFTIFKVAENLVAQKFLRAGEEGIPHYGIALVGIGILLLAIGIVYHVQFMLGLRRTMRKMTEVSLLHREGGFPLSFTLLTAIILLLLGINVIISMLFHIGPFG